MPSSLDIGPLLEEAKIQLHQEADYHREASMLSRYKDAVTQHNDAEFASQFVIPSVHPQLTTDSVLTMDFIEASPLDAAMNAPQETRNTLMTSLFQLFFNEIFGLSLIHI